MSGSKALHFGLMIVRFGIGVIFAFLGYPILSGGGGDWKTLGHDIMTPIGIDFALGLWGFLAAVAMAIGGLFIALGLLVRPFAFLLLLTMGLMTYSVIDGGGKFVAYHADLTAAVVFFGLLIAGGGDYAMGRAVKPLDGKWYQ
ncbi:MAG: DoxX family membrane protein [Planctomycetota bacterium]|jgi:putative oxidoreductase